MTSPAASLLERLAGGGGQQARRWIAVAVFAAAAPAAQGGPPQAAQDRVGPDRETAAPRATAGRESAGEDSDFLAFLEYLGSWEESDEEWQQFHPDRVLEASADDDADAAARDRNDGGRKTEDDRS